MLLEIAKWKENALSPVLFMVDDIANISVKKFQSDTLKIGEDWGQYAQDKNSMWDFLYNNLLKKFPEIKTTFFLVTDKRAPMALGESYTYTERIDKDEKFKAFLQYLHAHPNVELSYHGTTHGTAAVEHEEFLQEWETFATLNEAKVEINRGKELFKSVLGSYPTGGKYCGYEEGKFGASSIAQTGFKWWSYHWDGMMWDKNSTESKYNYDLEFNQGVVDIPTTVDGSTLSLKIVKKIFTKKYLKSLYLYLKEGKTIEGHIESLYNNREVIAVQEHSSPYRTDNRIQYPNIISDMDNLNHIFSLLAKKDVWYATCGELADYYIARENIKIKVDNDRFQLFSDREIESEITLMMPFDGVVFSLYDEEDNFISKFYQKDKKLIITYCFDINKIYKVKI